MNDTNGDPLNLLDPDAVDKFCLQIKTLRSTGNHSPETWKALHELEMATMRLHMATLQDRIRQSDERIAGLKTRMMHLSRQDS